MSSGFGVDFSQVRIHNDNEAVAMNNELQAQAFTHGRDIYFNEGKFDPDSAAGKFLLAHELAHVVQQDEGKLQKNISRSPSQQVPGISTPIPAGTNTTPAGDFEITINGAKVIIKPDTHSRRKGKDAKTNVTSSGEG
jgi:Domain of unknown function (DUF4157)